MSSIRPTATADRHTDTFVKIVFLIQGVSKRKHLIQISKVIFHTKLIPYHSWWECKNVIEEIRWFRNWIISTYSLGILYRSRKSKDEFVNQPHLTKIVKIRAFLVFWKIPILVSESAHNSLLIILITFSD